MSKGNERFMAKVTKFPGIMEEGKVIVDQETGVNYLFYQCGYAGGLTVLIDRNGKPIISHPEEVN